MEQKNHGVIYVAPKPTDYIFGTVASVPVARNITDWVPYLPAIDPQSNKKADFLDCVTTSGIHKIEANLNYLLYSKQLSDEALNFFVSEGYIKDNRFNLSVRFNAKSNGTDITKGQSLVAAANDFRNVGIIPESDWAMTEDMTWDEFYAPIPQVLKDKAKKSLWFLNVQYQFVEQKNMRASLLSSPVQIASAICAGWADDGVVQTCSGQPLQHATMLYGMSPTDIYFIMDHYNPFFKRLAANYELPYNMQYIVSMKPLMLRKGMKGANVLQLQIDLRHMGYVLSTDGDFGPKTEATIKDFQKRHGLSVDGIAGPMTLAKVKDISGIPFQSKIDRWCSGAKIVENARPSRNNPGNLRFIGQKYAVNDNGFCKFDTYQHGYEALRAQIVSACSGNNKYYNPNGNFYDFYDVYAPAEDNNNPKTYAEFIAKYIGVSPLTIIKTMLYD